ncbi:helix-turn-helix transcriptional regulator [Nibricoccus aquaticus]|nr:helix-turn-helix transcriptional regulator [Nibricoccus aquaticus]
MPAHGLLPTRTTFRRMSYPETTLNALVALQRAVTPNDVWLASNQLLRAAMPVFHTLVGLPCLGTMPVFLRTTLSVPDPDNYFVRLNAVAPLGPLLAKNPGAPVMRMSDDLPAEALPGLPFYEQFMKPEGWRYSAGLMFWSDTGEFIGQLSLIRTEAQGDITNKEMRLLRELHPLVNAAVNRLLASEKNAAAHRSLEHTVHALPLSIASLDWDLAIQYINTPAREALAVWRLGASAARSLKTSRSPQLPPDLRAACKALKADWETAVQTNTVAQLQAIRRLDHPSEPGLQATLQLVEPVSGRSLQPSFVLQFSRPAHEHHESAHALTELSKLTATEREVARLAAAGHKNPEIVRKLGVSESTVRTHLRSIFRKLGITSRGKLAPLHRSLENLPVRLM